jgi:hypothetical protein
MRTQTTTAVMTIAGMLLLSAPAIATTFEPELTATPQAPCGEGDRPETGLQGQVSQDDHDSGRAAEGFTCNTELVSTFISKDTADPIFGSVGGFKVLRYVDATGNECAYYDSTTLFPTNVGDQEAGVVVLDMTDPTAPVQTTKLVAPAMLQPHESLVLSQERGIIAAITGTLATNPAILNVYDIAADCRDPKLTTAFTTITDQGVPLLGHESGLSPDGMTFWAASTATDYVFAIDLTDLTLPSILYVSESGSHGVTVGEDGTRTYFANSGEGLIIVDTTDIANRVDDPQVTEISRLDWSSRSIPQSAIPFTNDGKEYLFEIDEFGSCSEVGAARIIDINDEANPFVLSNARLEVHDPANFDAVCDDPGTQTPAIQGYAGHYCSIPTPVDPTIAACSMIMSGLRIFDITDVRNPVEIAYFNAPIADRPVFDTPLTGGVFQASNWAMSAPAFVPERKEIWYSDAFQGFFAVRVTNDMWPDTLDDGYERVRSAGLNRADDSATTATASAAAAPDPVLAVTGAASWLQAMGGMLLLGALGVRGRRRDRADSDVD